MNIYSFISKKINKLELFVDDYKKACSYDAYLYLLINNGLFSLNLNSNTISLIDYQISDFIIDKGTIYFIKTINATFEEKRTIKKEVSFNNVNLTYYKLISFSINESKYKDIKVIGYPNDTRNNKISLSYKFLYYGIKNDEVIIKPKYSEIIKKHKKGETLSIDEKKLIIDRMKSLKLVYVIMFLLVIMIIGALLYLYFNGDLEQFLMNFKLIMLKYKR